MSQAEFEYDRAGVDTGRAQEGLRRLANSINDTHRLRDDSGFGRPVTGLGYYANVLELPGGMGLAIATDGVGTKLIVAGFAGRYDTVPIDMIAMNVNDILCVGAEPFALVDYIAVGEIDPDVFDQMGQGLLRGATESGVTIPGGEIAQVKEPIRGHGDSAGLDLIGTAVGLVQLDEVNLGQDVRANDVVIGLEASGLHSNGFTLARKVLLEDGGLPLDEVVPRLGCRLDEELLKPTRLYVAPVLALKKEGIRATALLHVTGDGFCNLNRVKADVGFELDALPEPGSIYKIIQEMGNISTEEMFSVFNMGIGFCVVVRPADAEKAREILVREGAPAHFIGRATDDHCGEVRLTQYGLIGGKERLKREA